MKRPPMFRAFDHNTNKMEVVTALYFNEKGELNEVQTSGYTGVYTRDFDGSEQTLMQISDCKDSNGKYIADGDILYDEYSNEYYLVENGGSGFYSSNFYNQSYCYPTEIFSEGSSIFEIVGNKFENPELMDKLR